MPDLMQFITGGVAIISMLMSYLAMKDRKSDSLSKSLEEKIRAQTLADTTNTKAEALNNIAAIKNNEIRVLQEKANECDVTQHILEERVNNLKELSEKIDEKLDKIMLIMMEKDDDDDDKK